LINRLGLATKAPTDLLNILLFLYSFVQTRSPLFKLLMNFISWQKILLPLLPLGSALLSSFLLWGNPVRADISIAPMVVEVGAKRGQTQGTIKVSNSSKREFRARVYTSPFTYDKTKGFQILSSSPNDLTPYIQFSPRELQVNGASDRNIRFVVRFPPSLPDGEYRAMIFTENLETTKVIEQDNKNSVTLSTNIIPRIGVAVYVRKGNVLPKLVAESATFDAASNKIKLLVRNTGNASAVLSGNWSLKKENQTVRAGNVNSTTVIALGEREFFIDVPNSNKSTLEPGKYKLSGELGWGENQKNRIPFNVDLTVIKK
jgi:hypothetical protein